MQFVIIASLAVVAVVDSLPQYPAPSAPAQLYAAPDASNRQTAVAAAPPVAIVRDERTQDPAGSFSVDFEAENGIKFSQSGSPDGTEGSVVHSGQYSYTAPDGTLVELKYVADENGYQPQSDLLPVAPAFPHPIPQFVLDQIAFAAEEDAAAARGASSQNQQYAAAPPPSNLYGQPQ